MLKACWCERKKSSSNVKVSYLYQPGELKCGTRRATHSILSLKVYTIERAVTRLNGAVIYYLHDGPKRGFCARRTIDCTAKYKASSCSCDMKLGRFGVDPVPSSQRLS